MTRRLASTLLFLLACLPITASPVARAQAVPEALQTRAERSQYKATASHDEVLALCKALDERSDLRQHDSRSARATRVARSPC